MPRAPLQRIARGRAGIPWLIALVALVSASAIWFLARAHGAEDAQVRFEREAEQVGALVQWRLGALVELARAVEAAGGARMPPAQVAAVLTETTARRFAGVDGWRVDASDGAPTTRTRGAPALQLSLPMSAHPGQRLTARIDGARFLDALLGQRFGHLSVRWEGADGTVLAHWGVPADTRFSSVLPVRVDAAPSRLVLGSTASWPPVTHGSLVQTMTIGGSVTVLALGALAILAVRLRDRGLHHRSAAEEIRAQLAIQEHRLLMALEGSGEGWWEWDPQRAQVHVSARTSTIYGLPGQDCTLAFRDWAAHIHGADRSMVEAAMNRHITHGQPFDVTHRILRPDGVTRWVRSRGRVRRDGHGAIVGAEGFVSDVTDVRLAQVAEAELAARHASVLKALPDLMLELDDGLRIVRHHAGEHASQAVGAEQFLNRRILEVLPAQVARPMEAACDRVLRGESIASLEYVLEADDGAEQTFEGRVVRIQTGGYLCIIRNIAERKRQEAELLRHRDNLAELVAEQTIDLLLAKETAERARRQQVDALMDLSRSLREPLHAILGFAELGAGAGDLARAHECFDRIERSASGMLALATQLPTTGRATGPVVRKPVDWAAVCDLVIEDCRALFEAKQMRAEVRLVGAVPTVLGDLARLREVVEQLVINAVRFSPTGGGVECVLSLATGGDEVVLEVLDRGIGLSEEDIAPLFRTLPLRHDAAAPGAAGNGLGICRAHVEAMGGRIEAAGRPGGGAVFRISLPAARETRAGASTP